jgi:hypothetical protein
LKSVPLVIASPAILSWLLGPVPLDFPFFARRDEFPSGEFGGHMVEGSDAGGVHGQDRGDRQSPMRGELVTMRFGNFLNQAVRAQEAQLPADGGRTAASFL